MAEGYTPPHSTETEKSVLGCLMLENSAIDQVRAILDGPEDFWDPRNQLIYRAITSIYSDNNPVDLQGVTDWLDDRGKLNDAGGHGYIVGLTRATISSANIEYHAGVILEKSHKRKFLSICREAIDEASRPDRGFDEVMDRIDEQLLSIRMNSNREDRMLGDILQDSVDELMEIQDSEDGIVGIPTGLALDEITSGWKDGDLITVAGRPSMGKTALALTIMINGAKLSPSGGAFGLFSLEMKDTSLGKRILIAEAELNSHDAQTGRLDPDEQDALRRAVDELKNQNIVINDTPAMSISKIRSKARQWKRQHDMQLMILDYIQLGRGTGQEDGDYRKIVTNLSRGCKEIAKSLDIPVIILSQLSRKVETHPKSRPRLSDLKESGSIEEDSDVVVLLYRPEYYGYDEVQTGNGQTLDAEGLAEVIVAKHRNGPTGRKFLKYVGEQMKFKNLLSTEMMDIAEGG